MRDPVYHRPMGNARRLVAMVFVGGCGSSLDVPPEDLVAGPEDRAVPADMAVTADLVVPAALAPPRDLTVAPTCNDGIENGDETDVDCGGSRCDPCDVGKGCARPSDCRSQVCMNRL